jgi:uncharacterized protein
MAELRLSEIWIYPIKSLGGMRVQHARIFDKGLEHDRRWMLVDEQGRFITQREHPEMAHFQLAIDHDQLSVSSRITGESIQFFLGESEAQNETVVIWNDSVQAHEVSRKVSNWFTNQLNLKCRLMYFPEKNSRPVDPHYAINQQQVSLADAYPFLIIGQASLDDLNKRLKEPVTMQRFRPNFVFTGGQAYEEDHWKNFSIGTNRFEGVKNCSRCSLTTVDPETGTKGIEPLQTLATYRKENNKVNFGRNALAIDFGVIHEGECIIR